MTAEEMVSRLLYRDGLMLVIDKPAGLAVHRGPNGGESLEDHFGALRFGLPRGPALAHRLDRDTSGCLVLGRHRKALAQLGRLFKNGAIDKTYWAVVEDGPAAFDGLIEFPLGRLDPTRGWWMKRDANGQAAVTRWKVLGRSPAPGCAERPPRVAGGSSACVDATAHLADSCPPGPAQAGGNFCWLALEPLTGRTHQLRVHCAEMGWPILGDAIYGKAPRHGGPMLHLHAREIVVPLYKNRAPIHVVAPLPLHMRARLRACGWRGDSKDALRAADVLPSRVVPGECSNRSSP
ncbi:MAG TPA: RNA pseudouridine synthase [Xanthobacteraceae bacterium]|jgi:tRNA pseudouridine32 synthase/23S rRNA pseudouridine746 synthase